MKKLIAAVLMMCLAAMAWGQSDHLTFKGVPIDGTLSEFSAKLQQKGVMYMGQENGIAMFSGEFAGYRDCLIGAVSSTGTEVVCKVAVIFSDRDTWSALYGNYSSLKDMLTLKYGSPSSCTERFDGYSNPTDDNSKMYEVKFDRCKYLTRWETDKGDIELYIEHNDVSKCYVMLVYWDKINYEKTKSSAMDDL